jgi:hypothetical protein
MEISKVTMLINFLIEENEFKVVIKENKKFSKDIEKLLV